MLISGAAGVGKTALVYGLTQKILELSNTSLPIQSALHHVRVLRLNTTALTAGCDTTGAVEKRIQEFLAELGRWSHRIVLVIEDIGDLSSTVANCDLLNLFLRPLLRYRTGSGRVGIRCVATINTSQLPQLSRDERLMRRFMHLRMEEASVELSMRILTQRKSVLSSHYRVEIADSALGAAIDLSKRYMPTRTLPDKAIDALGLACSQTCSANMISGSNCEVTASRVASVIADWTGIPSTRY